MTSALLSDRPQQRRKPGDSRVSAMPEVRAMRLEPVESPPVLPEFAASFSARLIAGDPSMYFAAGRECAANAIARLCGPDFPTEVGRGPEGEPLWPTGLTGSITHKDDFYWAAVARTSDALSIGIDAERIIDSERAERIAGAILLPEEHLVGGETLPTRVRVSLVFSIKESIFKCLYPIVHTRFYYSAVAITELSLEAGTFRASIVDGLSAAFHPRRTLEGRSTTGPGGVHTAVWLPGVKHS
jgi:enterobactin synthetase component D